MSKAKRLSALRQTPCLACGSLPSDVAHVRSKKASGINEEYNYCSLCRGCHRQSHQLGWLRFFERHPRVREHLEAKRWEFEVLNGKFLMRHAGVKP